MRKDHPSSFGYVISVAATLALTTADITLKGAIIHTPTEASATSVPVCTEALCGYEWIYINNAAATYDVVLTSVFTGGHDTCTIGPMESCSFIGVPDGSTGYMWAVTGYAVLTTA